MVINIYFKFLNAKSEIKVKAEILMKSLNKKNGEANSHRSSAIEIDSERNFLSRKFLKF